MTIYIFKANISKNNHDMYEVGIATASSISELFWTIDESIDPYQVVFTKYRSKRGLLLSVYCDKISDEEDHMLFPHDGTVLGKEAGFMGDSMFFEICEEEGWRRFVSPTKTIALTEEETE